MKMYGGENFTGAPKVFFPKKMGGWLLAIISRNEKISVVPYGIRLSYYAHLRRKLPMMIYGCVVARQSWHESSLKNLFAYLETCCVISGDVQMM